MSSGSRAIWIARLAALLAAAAAMGGCATAGAVNPRDPFEPVNRAVFEFNDGVDKALIKPVAQTYRAVLPLPVRNGVRNFFGNLRDPWIGANNLLQGKVEWAMSDLFRFAVNSTYGLAGINDVATDMRLEKHNEDFGQTLGRWGIESGPYIVLPILGPSSGRDSISLFVERYGYLPWQIPTRREFDHYVAWRNSLTALDFVSIRASIFETEGVLELAALDRYAFVRDAYLQRRRNLIYDGEPPPEPLPPNNAGGAASPASLETETSRPVAAAWRARAWVSGPARPTQVVAPRVPANYSAVLAAAAAAQADVKGEGK